MKYFLLPFLLILLPRLWAQPYKPMLEDENEWQVTNCYGGCLTDTYYTDGDTLVNNLQYKILDGYHFISRTFLLREEAPDKKVYLAKINLNHIDEYLLYDFSLEEGESFQMLNPLSPFPEDGGYFVLDSIRNRPLADGNLYRHFYFSPAPDNTISTWQAVWVEGAGSLSIINSPGGNPDVNGVGKLSCMFKGGGLFYEDVEIESDCNSTLSNSDSGHQENLRFYQDKKRQKLIVVSPENLIFVKIYDINGREVLYEKTALPNARTEINISQIPKGIYFISVINQSNKKEFAKIILQ